MSELHVVDCLLPGQVRRLGSSTYVTPRRPVRTTAADCEMRGGEYVAYDRADYRSALTVWLERAEAGDPQAQTYVGEIFEKGLGREPDFVAAAAWYRRAAEQGYPRAQINLGFLYEKGLGVEADLATALNWYRQASGLDSDRLVYASDAQAALAAQREKLEARIHRTEAQVQVLEQQLAPLRAQKTELLAQIERLETEGDRSAAALALAEQELAAADQQIAVLHDLYSRAEQERLELDERLVAVAPSFRSGESLPVLMPQPIVGEAASAPNVQFGRYFALVIGDQDYHYLDRLQSPENDARRIKQVLENRYGFSTVLLVNAGGRAILSALNDLYQQIGPEDNLLIYYAGHGSISEGRISRIKRGYWLPVDARPDRDTGWLHNAIISDHLDRLQARSVLVVADTCYAGDLSAERSAFLFSVENALHPDALEVGLSRRARVAISSGGEAPVLDTLDGEHSIFARSLIEVLERNEQVLSESMLFSRVAVNVRRRTRGTGIEQTPELRPIRAAGHEGGGFYFVPQLAAR